MVLDRFACRLRRADWIGRVVPTPRNCREVRPALFSVTAMIPALRCSALYYTELIVDQTRFKEDLEADSLDLYTLVQELEDTYGVRMTDEQAVQILTVGEAVEFVLAHD